MQKLKVFSKCFKHSMASQCKFCHSFYPTEIFLEHVKTCSKELNNFSRSHFFQMRLDCEIRDTIIMEDPLDHRTYTEYHIQVSFNNEKTWPVRRKYKAITSIRLMKFHYLDGYHPWIFIYLVRNYLIVSCHLWLPSITCAFSYFLRIIIGWTQGAIEDAAFPLSTSFPFLVLKLCLVARFL